MNLHRVPDVQSAEIAERYPPEPRCAHGAQQGPVDAGPIVIDHIGHRLARGRRRGIAVRPQPDILGTLAQQQIDRRQHHEDQDSHRRAGGAPSGLLNHVLHPWQQRHRADADAGECQPDRKASPANEPVGQKQRLTGIAEADAPRADHDADGDVEMPGLGRQRRQQHAARHQGDAEFHHDTGAGAIHQAADQRTDGAGNQEAERKRPRRDPAFPAELVDDRRKEQRKRGAGIHPDRHGDESHADDDPAVKEAKPHRVQYLVIPERPFGPSGTDGVKTFPLEANRIRGNAALRERRNYRRAAPTLQATVAPIQSETVSTTSLMTSRSLRPERASTWNE